MQEQSTVSNQGWLEPGFLEHLSKRTIHLQRMDKTKEKGFAFLGWQNVGRQIYGGTIGR